MNAANSISTAPYPGLRPFKQEEAKLFFGRETQTNEMLTRIEAQLDFRFLAVIGASGRGKSSLVRAGLLPALSQGFLLGAPADWKFVTARPGDAPLRNLANAWVDTFHPQTAQPDAAESEQYSVALAQLRAGPLGLVRAYRGEKATQGHTVLIFIDQFEELFRFRRERDSARRTQPVPSTTQSGQDEPLDETSRTTTSPTTDNAPTLEQQRNEAAAFVELLLATAQQTEVPLYVVITMRSDFLGNCDAFLGLPEAISRSQYLTPRMTRSQLEDAITRPLELPQFNARIEPTLVTRILNDVGTDPDQLPLMQHALMRTWFKAQTRSSSKNEDIVLTPVDYSNVGRFSDALSQHLEEAWNSLDKERQQPKRQQPIAQQLFLCLSERTREGVLIRRVMELGEVAAVANAEPDEVSKVVRVFQEDERNFIMASPSGELSAESVLDISHEALLRRWRRLGDWLDNEVRSAEMYRRLVETSMLHAKGKASLWRDPDLRFALDWREKEKPTAAWAGLYQGGFESAMSFLEKSKEARDFEVAEGKFVRKLRIVRNIILGLLLASLLIGPLALKKSKFALEPYSISNGFTESLSNGFTESLSNEFTKPLRNKLTESLPDYEIAVVAISPEAFADVWKLCNETWRAYIPRGHDARGSSTCSTPDILQIQERFPELLESTQDKDFKKFANDHPHLKVALKNRHVVFTQGNAASTGSDFRDLDLRDLKVEGKTKEALKKALKESDITLSKKNVPKSGQWYILAIPNSLDIISSIEKQTILIKAALKYSGLQELLMSNLDLAEQMLAASTLIVHLLAYFLFVFGVGAIYHRFAFRAVGGAADSAARQSPWETRWYTLLFHANEFFERFQSRRWKVILSVVLLLIFLGLFSSGLYGVWAEKPILILGVPLGVILILLVPTDPLLKRSWAPGFKVAQGILLQLYGFYALAGCVYLLTPLVSSDLSDKYGWEPDLLLVQNGWVLIIAGIGLVILGKRKCFLTAEETLVREPDRAPIIYLRLFEGDNRNRKETWGAWMSTFFRPNDEQLLRPIFGALGPFVTVGRPGEELSHLGTVDVSGLHKEQQQQATQLMRRSALAILQIDDCPTDGLGSKMRLTLQALKPEQVLVYFSQQMDAGQLRVAYNNFVEATRDAIPCALLPSIDSNHFLAFDKAWQPFLCGALTRPKFSWGKVMPLLGSRLDVVRMRRAIVRTLQPFFECRNQVNAQTKLYGDCAIGLAAFFLFGVGFPAGVMIFRNLWCMGRRWAAAIGLVAPFVGFVAVFMMIFAYDSLGLEAGAFELEAGALMVMVLLGSPFATYWLWRRLSGREIRLHAAFGGTLQPRWKVLLLLVAGFLALSTFPIIQQRSMVVYEKARMVVAEGGDLARGGDLERAITKFQEALKLDPDIDLDPETKTRETDPRAVAQRLAARAEAGEQLGRGRKLARQGDVEKALQAYAEAEKIDPSLATDARFWNDVAWHVSLGGHAAKGLEASEKAVMLTAKDDPRLASRRDTRGLARALTGNTAGAIEDFQAFIGSDARPDLKAQRQEWVNALRKGQQPFTPQLLETLWSR